jgi:5,10-methylenetetrahydromethanopterin reductase
MWQLGSRSLQLGLGIWQKYPYSRLVNLVSQAEELGYDALWCGNEKFYRDMWVMLGLVAAHAKRAHVGTFIAEPYMCHPVMIAAAIATADEALDGRAILLLGAGATGFQQLGLERRKPLTAIEESIAVIKPLLRGEHVTFRGKVIQANDAHLEFPARPDLPIWVASRGNEILEMAGRRADGVMIATYATPVGIRQAVNRVARGASQAGRDLRQIPITVRVDVCLDDDPGAARAAVKPMIAGMIKASYPNRDFIDQAGLAVTPEFYEELVGPEFSDMQAAASRLPESFVDAFSWAGTPEQVAEKVAAVLDMGIDRVTFLAHPSQASSEETVIRRFAAEVMPRVWSLMRG